MDRREEFINLLLSTKREGIENLVNWLDSTDFATAPASTKYHSDFKGGLIEHCLNVFKLACKFNADFNLNIPRDSLIIITLLHDLSKVNFYEMYVQNKKLYSNNGSKFDDMGRFDWVSVASYKIKDSETRFVASDHGTNSMLIAERFIKLTDDEKVAIINHHVGMDNGFVLRDLDAILNKNPLLMLLHLADMSSCYFTENKYLNERNN